MTNGSDSRSNPYPGLRPFHFDETHLFFGRDEQRTALLSRLRRSRFLAVVGTSGSGKSSLVRAGLLPGLYGGLMAGSGTRWRVADTRPGGDPIGRLAAALDKKGVLREEGLDANELSFTETTLRGSALGLVQVVKEARLPENERVFILVDQFEELFRFIDTVHTTESVNDASLFVKLLIEAAHQSEVPIYVVLTMRSDFLGDCARFRDLPEAINDSQYLIPRLTRAQRREAIVGPAAVYGASLSPALLNKLLNDVGDVPDHLPILQHALMRTWDHWKDENPADHSIDLRHYEDIGGMANALSRHAESVFAGLSKDRSVTEAEKRQRIAEKMFKCLTEEGDTGEQVRRLATLREIADVVNAGVDEVASVIEDFRQPGNSFIMPPIGNRLTPDTYVDISHESLIRNWERLSKWVHEEATSASIYKRLARTALLYPEKEDLLEGQRFRAALEWKSQQEPTAAWAKRYDSAYEKAMEFVSKSEAKLHAAEENRIRGKRIRKTWLAGFGVIVLFSLLLFLLNNAEVIIENERLLREQRATDEVLKNADELLTETYGLWMPQSPDSTLTESTMAPTGSNTDLERRIADLRTKLASLKDHKSRNHNELALELEQTLNAGDANYPATQEHDRLLFDILTGKDAERHADRLKANYSRDIRTKIAEEHLTRLNRRPNLVSSALDWILPKEYRTKIKKFWNRIREYAITGVVFLALPVWRWISLRVRRAAKHKAKPNPVWRVFAGLTDTYVAILLGWCVGAIFGLTTQIVVNLQERTSNSSDISETVAIFCGILVATAYFLFRDAIKYRFNRSIGKILFGLRPMTLDGGPTTLKISAKRNIFLLLILVLSVVTEFEGLLILALIVIGPLVWLILATVGKRRTLGDRIAKTKVVDIRSEEATTTDPGTKLEPASDPKLAHA